VTSRLDGHRVGTPGGAVTRRPSGEPPPLPRQIGQGTIAWWTAGAAWAAIWVWVFLSDRPGAWITERDLELMAPIVDHRHRWVTPVMTATNTITLHWLTAAVGWSTLVTGLVTRRLRHVVLLVGSLGVTASIATVVGVLVARPRPIGVEITGEWEAFAQPSRPLALATAAMTAGMLTVTAAGRVRRHVFTALVVVLAVAAFAQVYVGVEHPTDSAAGITIGAAVALAAFRLGAPESVFPIRRRHGNTAHLDVSGARGRAIVLGVRRQLGAEITALEPVGLAGSAGSTPLRLTLDDGRFLFAKLYARSHLRADRFYKLGRTLRYGQLEDEHRFATVRRLVQHEDHMLRLFAAAGIAIPQPAGIVELTPEREYLLVSEFLTAAVDLDETAIDGAIVDQGLETIERMWRAGLAHRDIKPANLMIRDGRMYVVDVAFAQIRPSPWRQAVDLANMMLVLGLAAGPETVFEHARRRFTDDELAEAFAVCRGVTIPGQLRRRLHDHDDDLLARFRALAPSRRPVRIQRWSLRRVALTVWVAVLALLSTAAVVGNLTEIGLAP
jgi:tRNA A-37 threonylcarbamoyl transferase component Bud32